MKYSYIAMILLSGCSNSDHSSSKGIFKNEKIQADNSNIELIEGVNVCIDNNSGKILSKHIDSSLLNNEFLLKRKLSKSILNESITKVRSCYSTQYLKKGDISFLLYNELFKVPIYETFNIQLDLKEENCSYADGLLEFLNEKRKEIVEKLNG